LRFHVASLRKALGDGKNGARYPNLLRVAGAKKSSKFFYFFAQQVQPRLRGPSTLVRYCDRKLPRLGHS
jgi:hypothetical protein